MALRITRLGTPGAHRAVAEVASASHQGVQAGVGALDVGMAMTEGMYLLSLLSSLQ
jgi:hypothetical protein